MLTNEQTGAKTLTKNNTQEILELEYDLRISLNSSTARILSCYTLSNPSLASQFSKYSQENLSLPTWIDTSDLVGGNTEEDVIRRGFQISPPSRGLKFKVGRLAPSKGQKVHKALLCQIIVGRSFPIEKSLVDDTELPEGYKSFYIHDENKKSSVYEHEYHIKNPSFVLPRYLVQYEYDPEMEQNALQKPKCDNCETETAVCYCDADKAYLCKKCDGLVHSTRIAGMHVRKPIGEGMDVFGTCKHHPERQIEYFCTQCHEPVCIDCSVLSSHTPKEGKHTLVRVDVYLQSVLEETQKANPNMHNRTNMIQEQIHNIHSRAEAVVNMGKEIVCQIDQICQKAKDECNKIIEKKITVLLGDEIELNRQLGEINRLEDFLKYQQAGNAMQCVYTWHLHQNLREQQSDFKFFKSDIDVQLDAKINGSIHVELDKKKVSPTKSLAPTVTPNISPTNLPSQLKERTQTRRTSDFFSEAFGGQTAEDPLDDLDTYSQISGYAGRY
ncbi:hypothetical protein HDV01_000943 [Terramyces sp. JEL0728]|nr:hypothetical protein HDV01_000943 [Terramyces sp. JEL0728]